MKRTEPGIARGVFALLIVLVWLTGCNTLALEKSISLEATYPTPNQSNVTVFYTVPPPPTGKVYVLWIVNPLQHDVVNVGQVSGGRNVTVHAQVNFEALGAVVSIEDQPNPALMSNTWALKVGTVTIPTPTPGGPGAGSTPGPGETPIAGGTPSAGNTPGTGLTPVATSP